LTVTDFLFRATTGHHSDIPCGFSGPTAASGRPAGLLDLDDLRAEVAEQLAAERAGEQLAELGDPQVLQRRSSVWPRAGLVGHRHLVRLLRQGAPSLNCMQSIERLRADGSRRRGGVSPDIDLITELNRPSRRQHRELLDAVTAGDPAWAEAVMRVHVLSARPRTGGCGL